MKQEHCNGMMWAEVDKNFVKLGLTPEFFRQTENIWHIMPPRRKRVSTETPVLSIITYDDMFSFRSPHNGHIVEFSERAQRIPDRLKPEEVIVRLQTDRAEEEEEAPRSITSRRAGPEMMSAPRSPRFPPVPGGFPVNTGVFEAPGAWNTFSNVTIPLGPQPAPTQQRVPTQAEIDAIRPHLTREYRIIGNDLILAAAQMSYRFLSQVTGRSRQQGESRMILRNFLETMGYPL